jgi:uncharacterized membrane protein
MKTLSTWNFRSIVGKIMLGLVVAAMIGSAEVVPSFGRDNHSRGGRQGGGRSDQRGGGHGRGRSEYGGRGHGYRSYGYREGFYVPPPVIYAPPPAPGIGIFFPSVIIRP